MENLESKTKKICDQQNINPARSKGQNFLINEDVYNSIVDSSNLSKSDEVLEVGPGLGFLTRKLALRVKKVVAVELDDKLALLLKNNLKREGISNVEVVNKDILNFKFKFQNYKIVANLPYNITSFFLRKFLENKEIRPEMMVLMLQKEVAERIVAKAPQMSLLACSIQFYANPEIVQYVSAGDFWPKPKVDSAILKINTRPTNNLDCNEKELFRIIKVGFASKRKTLVNNLASLPEYSKKEVKKYLKSININENARAQELSLIDWGRLYEIMGKIC